jgi:hypothetical protein
MKTLYISFKNDNGIDVNGYTTNKDLNVNNLEYIFEKDDEYDHFLENSSYYIYKNNKLVFIEERKNNQLKESQFLIKINNLKVLLNSTDYQVIKCYEAQLLQEEMPYDLQTLLAQRKAWRDEINQLEFEISMLG